jgi:cell division ATPase FtsA
MRVLTYAMPRARAEQWLELAAGAGAQARGLIPEAGPLARLVDRAPSLASIKNHGPIAVVDVGHARTEVVVVRGGKPVYARAVSRGGKHVTDAIARHWRLPWHEAEKAKHSDGFVASSTLPASSEAWARVSEVTITELAPLARELRQSFAACRARTGATVGQILLVGGGSRLRGLDHYLSEQLGLPVASLAPTDVEAMVGARLADAVSPDSAALALGMIADAATGRPLFDLRQGPLAAKVDLSFLRAKAGRLAVAVIAITACATASGFAAHYKLRKAEKVLTERLAVESTEEFGDPKTADEVLASATGAAVEAVNPLPKMTAWDILLDVTQRMPARDKVTLDIDSIEIDATKVRIEGTAATPDEVDAIEAALKGQTCFQEVTRGALQTLADGKRKFDFTIKAACM